jgi:Transcriptional regulators
MGPSSSITIHDVARAAGVSPSSISNYINGRHDQMGLETRKKIGNVIETLGYRPSNAARQLKTGLSTMIGLLVPTIANQFFAQLAAEVETAAQQYGFRLLLCNTQRNREKERQFAGELSSYGVRALILGSALRDPVGMLKLINRNVAVVAFDALLAEIGVDGIDAVSIDNALAMKMAVEHLAGLGHKDIAYVSGPLGTIGRDTRLRAYEEEMAARNLGCGTVFIEQPPDARPAYGDSDLVRLGHQAAVRISDMLGKPTAIIAMNDLIATGLMTGFQERNISVPRDISIIGMDDIGIASMTAPRLTTLQQPFAQMAEAAVGALYSRLNDRDLPNREVIFEPRLIIRSSTTQTGK